MQWMVLPLRRYADFSGRSQRKEYWMFALLMAIVYSVAGLLMVSALWPTISEGTTFAWDNVTGPFWLGLAIFGLFTLAMIVPGVAVTVRRLHDRDMSGWWYLGVVVLGQVPWLGALVNLGFLVLMCLPGTPGPNRFGHDPKGADSFEVFA